jgi:hypothetical protein
MNDVNHPQQVKSDYPFMFLSVVYVILFFAGFFFVNICVTRFYDKHPDYYGHGFDNVGAGMGELAAVIFWDMIWIAAWYLIMTSIFYTRKSAASEGELKANRFVLRFPVYLLGCIFVFFIGLLLYSWLS